MNHIDQYTRLFLIYKWVFQGKESDTMYLVMSHALQQWNSGKAYTVSVGDSKRVFKPKEPLETKRLVYGLTKMGLSAAQIADMLNMSVHNVHYHRKNPPVYPDGEMYDFKQFISE